MLSASSRELYSSTLAPHEHNYRIHFPTTRYHYHYQATMKSTSTITLLLVAAASVGPAQGREAMLGDEDKSQRRLHFKNLDYGDIYQRCCVNEVDGDWPDCNCPKRTSEQVSLFDKWFFGVTKTYAEKWEEQCDEGGWLYKQANPQ